jgi:hypothetical protein
MKIDREAARAMIKNFTIMLIAFKILYNIQIHTRKVQKYNRVVHEMKEMWILNFIDFNPMYLP